MKIRIKSSGDVIVEEEFRSRFSNTSFPVNLTPEILNDFDAEPVLEGLYPEVTENQYVIFSGVEKDANGKWITKYEKVDYRPEQLAQRLADKRAGMVVSPFQTKAALLQAGLLTQVEAVINDPATDPLVVLAWNNASEFRRTSPMIAALAAQLNLSDEQLDELFTNAAKIVA